MPGKGKKKAMTIQVTLTSFTTTGVVVGYVVGTTLGPGVVVAASVVVVAESVVVVAESVVVVAASVVGIKVGAILGPSVGIKVGAVLEGIPVTFILGSDEGKILGICVVGEFVGEDA